MAKKCPVCGSIPYYSKTKDGIKIKMQTHLHECERKNEDMSYEQEIPNGMGTMKSTSPIKAKFYTKFCL